MAEVDSFIGYVPTEDYPDRIKRARGRFGLTQQALQKQFPEYLQKLKKEAGVEILDEKLKLPEAPAASGLPPDHSPVEPAKKPAAK